MKPPESRDHQKDNVERMRKIQAAYKAKQQEEQQRQQTLGASAGGRSRPLRAVHSQHEGAKARVDTNLRTQAPVQVRSTLQLPTIDTVCITVQCQVYAFAVTYCLSADIPGTFLLYISTTRKLCCIAPNRML